MENCYPAILEALNKAASQNTELLKVAERQLKSWETEEGFYSTLMTIVSDSHVDVNIRWLAVLCLKNGVDRYWRRSAQNAITVEEKRILRQKLGASFNEPVNQIAVQLAVIIAKISRFDCPKEWPELFPTLLNVIQTSEDLGQQRALLTLHHVVKTLSTKRLAGDRRVFQQFALSPNAVKYIIMKKLNLVIFSTSNGKKYEDIWEIYFVLTSNIFSYLLHQWITHSKMFLQQVNSEQSNAGISLEKSVLTLKVLRKLIVYGFKEPSKVEDAVNLIFLIFQQIRPFIECRRCIQGQDSLKEQCEKYLILLVKVLHDVLELHPFSYVQFIRPTLECTVSFCFTKEIEDCLFERLTVQFLNMIKAILLCQEYKPAKLPEDTKEQLTLEAHKIKTEFFTLPVLNEICQQLVTRYFLLTAEDIKNWENNPEDFATDEGGESWKFSLRPCTEVLFLSIFHEFRGTLTPLVIEMIQNMQNINTGDFMGILKKEAVYNAVGLAAFDLYDEVNFDKWFTDVLIPELKIKENSYYIIRRRVIWLIGQWVGVKMSPEMRPLLYGVILQLLDSQENLVVRLAASNTLKVAVDDFEFSTEQFLPFLEASITALFYLLKEVRECDLKMTVLHVLSFIIERVGCQVRPYAASLMQYLPQLWENCGDHNMLRCAIISCFVHLVQGLGTISEKLHQFLLPMIALSTDVTQPPHVYLLEDGLDLWWAILENTSVCNSELLNLFSNLLPLLEYSSENLRTCLQITQAYVLLSPKNFLERFGQNILNTFLYIMTDMRSEGIIMILRVVEIVFIVFPEEGPVLFEPILSSVLSSVLQDEDLPVTVSVYLSLLSRVILHNQKCLSNVLQGKANELRKEIGDLFGNLLDIWLDKMPLVNPIERRKLLGLALACLLTTSSSVVHDRICGVLLAIVEVLNDIIKCDNVAAQSDSLVLRPDDFLLQDEDEETEHDRRKKELSRQDPVHIVVLKDYLYSQITELKQSVGATKFEDLMATVDVETMQQLQEYLHH